MNTSQCAVYQVKETPEYRHVRFRSYAKLKSEGKEVKAENYQQVYVSVIVDIRRSCHNIQYVAAEKCCRYRQQNRKSSCHEVGIENAGSQSFIMLCAEIFCDRYAETRTDSHAESQNQKLNAARCSDTCKSVRTEHSSNYSRVDHVVHLLQ